MLARIKKGDTVLCLSGKDSGRRGKVLHVDLDSGRITVDKLNMVKKHQRAGKKFQGGIIDKPNPISASRLMLVCPRCSKPTKVASKVLAAAGNKKVRSCKKCQEAIDKI
jgi:large subunit ribosomal protein L24